MVPRNEAWNSAMDVIEAIGFGGFGPTMAEFSIKRLVHPVSDFICSTRAVKDSCEVTLPTSGTMMPGVEIGAAADLRTNWRWLVI